MKSFLTMAALVAALFASSAVAQCPSGCGGAKKAKAACKCESCGCTAETKKADCKCDKCACCKKPAPAAEKKN